MHAEERKVYIPAAIVSPPRRKTILPNSLLTLKGSTGMGSSEPLDVLRIVISTLADVCLGRTLYGGFYKKATKTSDFFYLGLFLITADVPRSSVANSFVMVAGTSRE